MAILIIYFFLCSCEEQRKKQAIELQIKGYTISILDSIPGDQQYGWRSDAQICNNTSDTIWIYQSIGYNQLICDVSCYAIISEKASGFHYHPHTPLAKYEPILPNNCKQYFVWFPIEKWSLDSKEFYVIVSPYFLAHPCQVKSISNEILNPLREDILYRPFFQFHIVNKINTYIEPIEGNIDSLLKKNKLLF